MEKTTMNPLFLAACRYAAGVEGNTMAVDAMAESGADIDDKNDKGYTTLMLAAHHGHPAVIERLLDYGASISFIKK